MSPIDAGDRGGAILATRQVGEWLVSTVSGTVVHPRLSAYWPWVYRTLMARGMRDDAVQLARQVLGTGRWGDNDHRGTLGDIHVYENPYNGDVEFFRLAAFDGEGRYWYFSPARRTTSTGNTSGRICRTSCRRRRRFMPGARTISGAPSAMSSSMPTRTRIASSISA